MYYRVVNKWNNKRDNHSLSLKFLHTICAWAIHLQTTPKLYTKTIATFLHNAISQLQSAKRFNPYYNIHRYNNRYLRLAPLRFLEHFFLSGRAFNGFLVPNGFFDGVDHVKGIRYWHFLTWNCEWNSLVIVFFKAMQDNRPSRYKNKGSIYKMM